MSDARAGSFLTRLADNLETVQLEMAEDLLGHVDKMVADRKPSEVELLSIVAAMRQALRDALRVARSRGDRLPVPEDDAVSREAAATVDREVMR
jgi:hypothetical protein